MFKDLKQLNVKSRGKKRGQWASVN